MATTDAQLDRMGATATDRQSCFLAKECYETRAALVEALAQLRALREAAGPFVQFVQAWDSEPRPEFSAFHVLAHVDVDDVWRGFAIRISDLRRLAAATKAYRALREKRDA